MSAIFHAGISGARGRMGRAVSAVLDAREDVVVAARFDRGETPDLSLCDVIIDFSTPDHSVELARACAARGGPALVIGSTGLSPEQDAEILKAAETVAIVRSGNFSLGVNILIGLVEHAAQRRAPTASLSTTMDSRVAKMGAVKPMVVASASGSIRRVWKISRMPVTPRAHRHRCTCGRLVFRAEKPSGRVMTQTSTTGRPNRAR